MRYLFEKFSPKTATIVYPLAPTHALAVCSKISPEKLHKTEFRFRNQNAFSSPEDQEIAAFYTSCEGENVFSDQLSTAFIQGRAAQGLLDALDDDDFATQCPEEVC